MAALCVAVLKGSHLLLHLARIRMVANSQLECCTICSPHVGENILSSLCLPVYVHLGHRSW